MKRRELLTSLGTSALMAIIAEPAIAQPMEIVGTWKFSTYVRTDPITGKNTNIFGEHPRGWLIYTAEGRMMVIVVPESRKPLEQDEDRIEHHKQMVAYTGRYTIAGDKVIHHVDVAWNEAWIGSDLVRSYRINRDTLVITTGPTKYGIDGVKQVSTLPLERAKSQ
jgi:Lipocalin-like domain